MMVVQTAPPPSAEQKFDAFLQDIEPFFVGQPFFYLDVGAYRGETFRTVFRSPLRPKRACLMEPNPASFARLREMVRSLGATRSAACYPVGIGAAPGRARFRADDTMTRVLALVPDASPEASAPPAAAPEAAAPQASAPEAAPADAAGREREFTAEIRTLDGLAGEFLSPRVSLLKIDVEGFELDVLAGAENLLRTQSIDMIYIEAGLDPEGGRQTYYRRIEDRLRSFGYGLFRVYEQTNEWPTDSPLLRRVNLAFMSRAFADGHPMRLSREVFALRRKAARLEGEAAEREAILETARAEARAAAEAGAAAAARFGEREAALQAELGLARARTAEQARQLTEAEARAGAEAARAEALVRDLQRLRSHGRTLETRHLQLLRSTSWRVMEPARRTMRLLQGKKAPPCFEPMFGGTGSRPAADAGRSPQTPDRKS